MKIVPSPYCDCKVCIDHFTRMKVLEERYIEHLHEIEQEIDDDECDDRWQEAIYRTNQRYVHTSCQTYSLALSSGLKIRPRSRAH